MATHTTTVIPSTTDMSGSGQAIFVAFACDDDGNPGTTATCADSQGNTYSAANSKQVSSTGSASGVRTALFCAPNATALTGTDTITVTHGAVVASAAIAFAFNGMDTAATILDQSAGQHQTSAQHGGSPTSTATTTLSQANCVFVGAIGVEANALDPTSPDASLVDVATYAEAGTTGGGSTANIWVAFMSEVVNATTGRDSGYTANANATDITSVVAAYKAVTGGTSVGDPKIMVNGTETSLVLTTSNALYTKLYDSASYPTNAAAIGMRSSGTTADTFMYECGMLVAYIPAAEGIFNPIYQRRPFELRV